METAGWVLFWTGALPFWRAWRANRLTSLGQTIWWGFSSWLVWGLSLAPGGWWYPEAGGTLAYLALSLTGCTAIAALGARRPGVGAWNFVVIGLLVVVLLPLAEGFLLHGAIQLGSIRAFFLAGTILVGVLNYLPTRLAFAALLLAAGCGLELLDLGHAVQGGGWLELRPTLVGWLLGLTPWVAWMCMLRWGLDRSEFDQRWFDFRDRYGFVWGRRLQEQFNAAAVHANRAYRLGWSGLQAGSDQPDALATLAALMKRFGPPEPEAPAE